MFLFTGKAAAPGPMLARSRECRLVSLATALIHHIAEHCRSFAHLRCIIDFWLMKVSLYC